MSVLSAIRKQENPDGIDGHNERLKMQEENKKEFPKRVFTHGGNSHRYCPNDIRRTTINKENLLNAKWFCRELCCNPACPLRGV